MTLPHATSENISKYAHEGAEIVKGILLSLMKEVQKVISHLEINEHILNISQSIKSLVTKEKKSSVVEHDDSDVNLFV